MSQQRVTGKQIAAGRVLSGVSRAKLGKLAHVAVAELKLIEANDSYPEGQARDVRALQDALIRLGVVFIPEDDKGAGVRLKYNRSDVKQLARLEGEGGAVADDDI